MLNFSLRFLGQSIKLLARILMALGGVILFSCIRLITDYFLTRSDEDEMEPGMTIQDAYQGDTPAGSLPSDSVF
ncbi:hypothetical protein [Comamonas sp.]|uniref:hypothetical protein n=1 Tax=Comamonas sp. TaxID=34028 RepID=UPI002583215B|nr:hypothetical protein [Comamonas sp.]